RRWQLAAEASGALGLLIRPQQAKREPSWAELRLLVTPCPTAGASHGLGRRVSIRVLRWRGSSMSDPIELELHPEPNRHDPEHDHEPYRLSGASALAAAATG